MDRCRAANAGGLALPNEENPVLIEDVPSAWAKVEVGGVSINKNAFTDIYKY